jgi:hypothetical protein
VLADVLAEERPGRLVARIAASDRAVLGREVRHVGVAGHLGDDGSGGDQRVRVVRTVLGVDRHVQRTVVGDAACEPRLRGVAGVTQSRVARFGGRVDGLGVGCDGERVHIAGVDARDGNFGDSDRTRGTNRRVEVLATRGREPLRICDAVRERRRIPADAGGEHRP